MTVLDDLLLTPERAAIHLPSASAVIADVHLGYGEARRRGGDAVPLPDGFTSLAALQPLVKAHALQRLIVAGDLFEAGANGKHVAALIAWCGLAGIELAVVPGNHDRGLGNLGDRLAIHPDGVTLGRWRVVHGDGALPDGAMVQGHEHPWARWSRRVGGPCFLVSQNRLILPAFSRDAAGVNVLGDARWAAFRCYVVAGDRVLDFGELKQLKPSGKTGQLHERR
jgi:metallophosphoesterase superfamily enzyme